MCERVVTRARGEQRRWAAARVQPLCRRVRLCACACGRDASRASRATATKLRNVGSGQRTSAAPWNQEGSPRKTTAAITTLANQPRTRNSVARTMPQKPSSGRPTADAKSSTFQATQKNSGPSRIAATSATSATASPPATRAPIPRMRSTTPRTGLTRRVYDVRAAERDHALALFPHGLARARCFDDPGTARGVSALRGDGRVSRLPHRRLVLRVPRLEPDPGLGSARGRDRRLREREARRRDRRHSARRPLAALLPERALPAQRLHPPARIGGDAALVCRADARGVRVDRTAARLRLVLPDAY